MIPNDLYGNILIIDRSVYQSIKRDFFLISGIDFVIPLLGAFAAGFIVIFPGLCLLEVALTRYEEKTRFASSVEEEAEEEEAQGTQANNIQTDVQVPSVAVKSAPTWRDGTLIASAVALLVFGAFMLGIIVTNSFMNLNPKPPLCV